MEFLPPDSQGRARARCSRCGGADHTIDQCTSPLDRPPATHGPQADEPHGPIAGTELTAVDGIDAAMAAELFGGPATPIALDDLGSGEDPSAAGDPREHAPLPGQAGSPASSFSSSLLSPASPTETGGAEPEGADEPTRGQEGPHPASKPGDEASHAQDSPARPLVQTLSQAGPGEVGGQGTPEEADGSAPGDEVTLSGLRNDCELNGMGGRLVSLDPRSGRWQCLLDNGITVNVRPENFLRPRGCPAPSPTLPGGGASSTAGPSGDIEH